MAYKRISPMPIVEGGTNAITMATQDGVVIFDGTRLVTTAAGTNAQVLTSNGAGVAPTFQNAGAGGSTTTIFGVGGESNPVSGYYELALGNPSAAENYFAMAWMGGFISDPGPPIPQSILAISGTASHLYVYVYANNSTVNVAVTIYKNNAASALTITIPALTTGTFSDTTHSVAFTAATDTIKYHIGAAATGQIFGTTSFKYVT